ncbi:putative ribonuclease H protein [Glycine max]|nr:putative ribonuclease H protein [Glycine max]
MDNVKAVKAILRSYEMVSDLRINFAKSQFRAIGQSEEWCCIAVDFLNCAMLHFPFCYLGLPIGINPRRKVVWEPIIRKLEPRLNKSNHRSISMVGRITLINVVLTALPLFYLSFFRAPSAVINRLTVIQRNFLWGGNLEGKKIAWVAWSQVCASRERGGLGIKDIKALNNALLIKWKWFMFQQTDQLWSRILISKYKGWRGLEEGPPKPHFSHWWYDLRSINQHRSMAEVSKQFIWKLGRGDQILLWEDSWVDGGITLKEKYLELYRISLQRLQIVAYLGSLCESGWEWKFSWRRNLFDNEMGIASAFID